MDTEAVLEAVKLILGIEDSNSDKQLTGYISMAEKETISWRFGLAGDPADYTFPKEYETVLIHAVVTGFNLAGAEGQTSHSENGISRVFRYSDMLDYIHRNVIPFAGVPR